MTDDQVDEEIQGTQPTIPPEDIALEFDLMVEAGAKVLLKQGYTMEHAKSTVRSILLGPSPIPFPENLL